MLPAVGLQQGEQVGDAVRAGGFQNPLRVIDEQCARRIEGMQLLQAVPECLLLLGRLQIVRDDHAVEPVGDIHFRHFDIQRLAMRIRHHHHVQLAGAQFFEKFQCKGPHAYHVL